MTARAALPPAACDAHAILRGATHGTHLRLHGLFFRGDTGPRRRALLAKLQRDCGEAELPQLVSGAEAGFALFERRLAA